MSTKKPESYSSLLSLDSEVKKKPKPPIEKVKMASKLEHSKINRHSRSRSPKNKKMKPSNIREPREEISVDWDIPDRRYGDLYCKPCDSHMNSDQMWEAHIQGKRHLKHVKKGEVGDLKYDYLDEDPIMIKQLNEETRPIVGLQHLVEIQRLEQRPIYQCFLCSANVPSAEQLLEHIVGTKHRLAYLKEHDPERHELIQNSNLKKGHIEPVVEECIERHEARIGRGKMVVKREREDYKSPPRKSFKSDHGFHSRSNKSNRTLDLDPRRSQRERSFDSVDDHSSQGRFADRDNSYYKKSDDFSESYSRSGYNDRPYNLHPETNHKSIESSKYDDERHGSSRFPLEDVYGSLLSTDDKYGSNRPSADEDRYRSSRSSVADDRYGSSRPSVADDRYGSSRPPVADDRYGSSRPPVADDRYGSSRPPVVDDRYGNSRSVVADDRYGMSLAEEEKNVRYRTSLDEDRYGDLREVLEKKKSLDPYLKDNVAAKAMAESFLSSRDTSSFLAMKDSKENTFLNAVGNNAALSASTGNNTLAALTSSIPDAYLKMIETMSPTVFLQLALFKINRIEINNELDLKLLDKLSSICTALSMDIKASQLPTDLKEQFKETMVLNGLGISPQFAKDYQQIIEMVGQAKANSKPVNLDGNSAQQFNYQGQYSNPTYSIPTQAAPDKTSATHQRSSPDMGYSTSTTEGGSGFSWKHVDSTQAQPASSIYSTASYIPGLTLTNDSNAPPQQSSPFDLLARQAKDILGGIKTKTDSYRY